MIKMYIFSTHHRFWNIYMLLSLSLFPYSFDVFKRKPACGKQRTPIKLANTVTPTLGTYNNCVHGTCWWYSCCHLEHWPSKYTNAGLDEHWIDPNKFVSRLLIWCLTCCICHHTQICFSSFDLHTIHSFFFLLLAMFGLPGTPCCCSVTKRCPPTPLWPRGKATVWVGRWAG